MKCPVCDLDLEETKITKESSYHGVKYVIVEVKCKKCDYTRKKVKSLGDKVWK